MRTLRAIAIVLAGTGLPSVHPTGASAATITLSTLTDQSPTVLCSAQVSTTDVATGVTLSDTCAPAGVPMTGLAEARGVWGADGLVLGASYELTGMGAADIVFAGTSASFEDDLVITGGTAGTLGYLELAFGVDGRFFTDWFRAWTDGSLSASAGAGSGILSLSDGVNELNLTVPFLFGAPFDLTIGLGVGTLLIDGSNDPGRIFTAIADFYSTAALSSVHVMDSSGAPISNARVISASGLDYPIANTAVPEPTSLLLLGTGLISVAVRRRRGRMRCPAPFSKR